MTVDVVGPIRPRVTRGERRRLGEVGSGLADHLGLGSLLRVYLVAWVLVPQRGAV